PDDPRRARCADGLRAAAPGAARGAGGSRPPRIADSTRLHRNHRRDHPRAIGQGDAERIGRRARSRGAARKSAAMKSFAHRHLLGMADLSAEEIVQVLDLAETFVEISERPIKKVPTLRGKTVINLFLEPSTRTRTSFEIAAKRLSADAINI